MIVELAAFLAILWLALMGHILRPVILLIRARAGK